MISLEVSAEAALRPEKGNYNLESLLYKEDRYSFYQSWADMLDKMPFAVIKRAECRPLEDN